MKTETTSSSKTLEQLTADAAEAQKVLDALKEKQTEIEKQKREAEENAKQAEQNRKQLASAIDQIKLVGPAMKLLVHSLNLKATDAAVGSSIYNEYAHGKENQSLIHDEEETTGYKVYKIEIGTKTVTLTASPTRDVGSSYHSRYEVVGAVRMTIGGEYSYKSDKTATYKTFESATKKIATAIKELQESETATATKTSDAAKELRDIEAAARIKYPTAHKIEASHPWVDRSFGNRRPHGYQSSTAELHVVLVKDGGYSDANDFRLPQVELKDGKLTFLKTVTVVTRVEV